MVVPEAWEVSEWRRRKMEEVEKLGSFAKIATDFDKWGNEGMARDGARELWEGGRR